MNNLNNPLLLVDGKYRLALYVVLGFAAFAIGALDAFYGDADPEWVQGLVRAAVWAAPIVGLTAATHTTLGKGGYIIGQSRPDEDGDYTGKHRAIPDGQ